MYCIKTHLESGLGNLTSSVIPFLHFQHFCLDARGRFFSGMYRISKLLKLEARNLLGIYMIYLQGLRQKGCA